MATDAGTALAKPSKAQLELAYAAILDGKEIPAMGDPEVISRQIAERILAAETFEEAFQAQNLTAWKDKFLNVPVFVRDIRLNPSGFKNEKGKGGSSVYAVVDVQPVKDSGELGDTEAVHTGGRNVLIQLMKMLEKGWTDKPVRMIAKDTTEGYEALWLEDGSVPY